MAWPELRDRFRTVVNMRRRAGCTIEEVADSIPAGKSTVYRILAGEVSQPSLSLQKSLERFVAKASQVGQPAPQRPEPDA